MSNKTVYPYGTDGELPSSIGLINDLITGGADKALAAEQGKVLRNTLGDGFFVQVDEIDLSSLTEQACTLGTTTWYKTSSSPAVGKHIAAEVTPGGTYKLTLTYSPSGGSFYSFVTSSYSPPYQNGDAIPFAGTYTERCVLGPSHSVVLTAPDDAAYLVLVKEDGAGYVQTWRLEELIDGVEPKTVDERIRILESSFPERVRIATWNVGNFSLGTSGDPTITPSNFDAMKAAWRSAINDIGVDILCCCEYNTNFMDASTGVSAVTARDAIFTSDVFHYAQIGNEILSNKYMQTAIFANKPINEVRIITYPQTTQAGRYYQSSEILIGEKVVKVVATHLDFNQGSTDAEKEQSHQNRIAQINKLISDFSDFPYVIICADYNVPPANVSDYDIFKNAGYGMVNHGFIGDINTYPAGDSPVGPLDNIVYKGFVASKIDVKNDENLSDHMAIMAELTLIK